MNIVLRSIEKGYISRLSTSRYNSASVAARKSVETAPEPNLTQAAEQASLMIRGLQSRLRPRAVEPVEESPDQLEEQLQQYFERASPDLRGRVVEGVVDRILQQWDGNSLESEIVDRLIARVLDRINKD